jgi:DNA-binding NarL/FixJ family response regulator
MSYQSLSERTRSIAEERLTARQLQVLRARVDGHSWERIADSMNLDEATARGHWKRAVRRLKPHLTEGDLAA